MAYVYKLTRTDGLEYIGITTDVKRRLKEHERALRFQDGIEKVEVLFDGSYDICEAKEAVFITEYDTYKNGLNVTPTGKGKSDCKFNTYGYKYSEESKIRMSLAKQNYVPWNKGKTYSLDLSDKQLGKRKERAIGSNNSRSILDEILAEEIIKKYQDRPEIDGVGNIQQNGRPMSYDWAFCNNISEQYRVTPATIKLLIKRKNWKHVWAKFKV